jgi:hypothetical protein
MALLWTDSFDGYTAENTMTSRYPLGGGFGGLTLMDGRNGGRAFRAPSISTGNTVYVGQAFETNQTEIIFGMAFQWLSFSADTPIFTLTDGASTQQIRLQGSASNQLEVYRNGTVIASAPNPFLLGKWFMMEGYIKVANSGGRFVVKKDGVTIIDFTGDTQSTANAYATHWYLGTFQGPNGVGYGADDLYILTPTGDDPVTYLTDWKVESAWVTANGNSAQFTPSAGSNWQNVDEINSDSDTTYNSSNTVGHKDTFVIEDLATTSGEVIAVQVFEIWRKDDVGARTARQIVRSGGTDYEGPDVAMNDAYSTNVRALPENPDTSAPWTISEVNSAEVGYKLEA